MIEEVLISFETAKIAKEKGFPQSKGKKGKYREDGTMERLGIGAAVVDMNNEWFEACTQSLLQKWLREVHGIYVESYHDLKLNFQGVQYYTNWGFIRNPEHDKIFYGGQRAGGGYDEFNEWKTYEESLEYGLQQALKMI